MGKRIRSVDLTRLRRYPHQSKVYMVVQKGTSLFTAKVNDSGIATGETVITYDNDSGEGNVKPGMTLFNKSLDSIGNEKGSARIKSINTSTNKITIEPNSIGWKDNDVLLCDGIFRLYRILPKITAGGVVKEDQDKTYNDENDKNKKKPVPLMGCPRYAWVNEPINFYGWRSYAKAQKDNWNRARIDGWAWDFAGGTIVGGGANNAGRPSTPNMVKWTTTGERNVSLAVTDSLQNSETAYRPVIVVDRPGQGDNPPYEDVIVESMEGDWGSGEWSASVKVTGSATSSDFPNNALVILFCVDWYNELKVSIGGWWGQEDILMCGYVVEDSVRQDFEKGEVTFRIASLTNQMKETWIWPLNFKNVSGNPTGWHEFEKMTIEDIIWHIIEEHSTIRNLADVFVWTGVMATDPGADDPTYGKRVDFFDATEASLYDILDQQLLSAIFGHVASSRYCTLHCNRNYNLLTMEQRQFIGNPLMMLEKGDWYGDLEIAGERHRDSVAQVDFIGFIYDSNGDPIEVYSLAPANQKNFGRIEKVSGILLSGSTIADAQLEANTLSGLYLAHENIRFPQLTVYCGNNRIFDPAEQTIIGLALEPEDTTRGYNWVATQGEGDDAVVVAGKEFICRRVNYEFDHENGVIKNTITFEASTWGPDGTAGPYPPPEPPPCDEDCPPPPIPPPDGDDGGWAADVVACTQGNGVFFSQDFTGPGGAMPTWGPVNDGLTSLDCTRLIVDPYAPDYRWWLVTRTGGITGTNDMLWRREGSGSWEVVLNEAIVESSLGALSSFALDWPRCTIDWDGLIYCLVRGHNGSYGVWLARSYDYGDSWSYTLVRTTTYTLPGLRGLAIGQFRGSSPYPAGAVVYAAYFYGGVFFGVYGKTSTDWGATFGSEYNINSYGWSDPQALIAVDSSNQDILYIYQWGAGHTMTRRTKDRGASFEDLIPDWSGEAQTRPPSPYVWNNNVIHQAGGYTFRYSDDGFASWTNYVNTDGFNARGVSRVMSAPDNLYGVCDVVPGGGDMQHVIAVSDNLGQNYEGKAGNSPDVAPYTDSIPNTAGVGNPGMVAIWTTLR